MAVVDKCRSFVHLGLLANSCLDVIGVTATTSQLPAAFLKQLLTYKRIHIFIYCTMSNRHSEELFVN